MSNSATVTGLPKEKGAQTMSETLSMPTVIACSPGIMEQSLRGTLDALPAVEVVGSAPGCLSALYLVRDKAPALLVIDANLPNREVEILLRQVREDQLRTSVLVLSRDRNQRQHLLLAGADAVFRPDGPIRQLAGLIAGLNHGSEEI